MKKIIILSISLLLLAGISEAQWDFNGTNINNTNTGNVGIGTNTPGYLLHVSKNMVSPSIRIQNAGGTGGAAFEMIDNLSGADWKFKATNAGGFKIRDHVNGLDVFVIEPNSSANALYINAAGNVGIGTIVPTSRLQVNYDSYGLGYLGYNPVTPFYFYHQELPANGDGQSALYGYRSSIANNGTGYTYNTSNSAIMGYSFWGDEYSFSTSGFNYNDYTRCGGVLGAQNFGSYWGSLGYKDSGGSGYGGYFTSWNFGGGKSSPAKTGIGLGAWGDLMGADIHGKVYGVYVEGENYAMFSNGAVFKNDLDIHLQQNKSGTNTVLYTNVSTDVTIQTSGYATLSNGQANIDFDPAFASAVSGETPIVVTVTPNGNSNGVYLSGVSTKGFRVAENNEGKSSVTISYIAIGKRAGYERPDLPREVIESDYTQKLARGLHNDSDTQSNGEGLFYENGHLMVGIHPSTLPDPDKPAEETLVRK